MSNRNFTATQKKCLRLLEVASDGNDLLRQTAASHVSLPATGCANFRLSPGVLQDVVDTTDIPDDELAGMGSPILSVVISPGCVGKLHLEPGNFFVLTSSSTAGSANSECPPILSFPMRYVKLMKVLPWTINRLRRIVIYVFLKVNDIICNVCIRLRPVPSAFRRR